jgi:hypothetical protein
VIRIHRIEQRTPEWYQARAAKVTGSVADALYAKLKSGGEPAARRDLRVTIAVELVTGGAIEEDGYQSFEMKRGIELEPDAFEAYEAATGQLLERVGFVERLDCAAGCSPDGVVLSGDRIVGMVQLKCPKTAIHIGYIRDGVVPSEYVAQVTHELWVTGADWLDFISFDPRLPEDLQLFRKRVTPADFDMADHRARVEKLIAEARVEADSIRALRRAA